MTLCHGRTDITFRIIFTNLPPARTAARIFDSSRSSGESRDLPREHVESAPEEISAAG
jgi:hypothetical protein